MTIMNKDIKRIITNYVNWLENQPKNYYKLNNITIGGIEFDTPNDDQNLLSSLKQESSKFDVTLNYYMNEFYDFHFNLK